MRVAAQVTTVRTPKPAAKPASRSRLAFLRGRSWKVYAALAVGIPFLLFTLVVSYYYVVFSRMIDARMHGEFQRTDPRIFARPLTVRRQGFYGLVLAKGGAVDDARALIRVIEAGPDVPGRISALSRLYLAVGDTTRALAALEQVASGDGDLVLAQIFSSSNLDKIRGSRRFAAVLRRFNLDVERLTAPDGGRSR